MMVLDKKRFSMRTITVTVSENSSLDMIKRILWIIKSIEFFLISPRKHMLWVLITCV